MREEFELLTRHGYQESRGVFVPVLRILGEARKLPALYEGNLDRHGLSLADAGGFEWETAVVREDTDTRKQYVERRIHAREVKSYAET